MTDLIPMTALGARTPRVLAAGPLTLTERPEIALASLALRRGAVPPAPFGLVLPGPGETAALGEVTAVWTGPGQWMIAGEGLAGTGFAERVAAAAPGTSVTDQTDGWVWLEMTGPADGILSVAERLVNLPPAALAPGHATRTGLHHMSVFLVRPAPGRLAIWGMRSAAGSLWHAIATAMTRLEVAS